MLTLHRRMFGDVWTWAGTLRQPVTNVGLEPFLIATQSQLLLDDATFWHTQGVFGSDELAARIHCRLVSIHPFRNGNGRCTRMDGRSVPGLNRRRAVPPGEAPTSILLGRVERHT